MLSELRKLLASGPGLGARLVVLGLLALCCPQRSLAAAPCAPKGTSPAAYSAPSLDGRGRIDLSRGWRIHIGPVRGGERPNRSERGFRPVRIPGELLRPTKARRTTAWLRKTFRLPEGLDPRGLALDLGQRPGLTRVFLNGRPLVQDPRKNEPTFLRGPLPLRVGRNVLALEVTWGRSVGGLRWTGAPALGRAVRRHRGLLLRRFDSRIDGSRQEVTVYVPRCADLSTPRPLVVALPGWGGNVYSYAHSRLMREAERRGWLVLTPDPRGNVLYTAESEEGVLEALQLVRSELPVDPDRVYLMGLSMGGAGALQVGAHFPDRFAAVVAFFGDSFYELKGYIGRILGTRAQAERYSVIHTPGNLRNVPTLLIHARDDAVSPFIQSRRLADLARKRRLKAYRLVAPRSGGHTLQLVEQHIPRAVAWMAAAERSPRPRRVSFRSNAGRYRGAYWLGLGVAREGRFGGADLVFDRKESRLSVHELGPGLSWAAVDLGALGLSDASRLRLRFDQDTHAPLRLRGLRGWRSATLHRSGGSAQRLEPGPLGRLDLPPQRRGEVQILLERPQRAASPP